MVAPPDHRQQLALDLRPRLDHLPIADSHYQIATCNERKIAAAVLLEIGALMPLCTVEFEHQTVAHEQIDMPDAGYPHLGAKPDPASAQGDSRDGLDPGLARPVEEFCRKAADCRPVQDGEHLVLTG